MDKPQQPFADGMPNLSEAHFEVPTAERVEASMPLAHAPRFLILYGSLRARSFSRFLAYEAARLLEAMGGEVRIYDAHGRRCPTTPPPTTRRCRSCGSSRSGPRARSGSRRSATAP